MKVCKHCGCEYLGQYDKCEPSGTSELMVRIISPSWVREDKKVNYPLSPIPAISFCSCPCHWLSSYHKDAHIKAYKEIVEVNSGS